MSTVRVIPEEALADHRGTTTNVKALDSLIKLDDLKRPWMFPAIFGAVKETLLGIPDLKMFVATDEDHRDNIQRLGEDNYCNLLKAAAANQDWRGLLANDVFFKSYLDSEGTTSQMIRMSEVNERAWKTEFHGHASQVLLMTISTFLDKRRTEVHCRSSSIVNSAGTGKSRMVDELGMKVLTVSMCLRNEGTEGFPPADKVLRDWLSRFRGLNIHKITISLHGLFYGLLTVTRKYLEALDNALELGQETTTGRTRQEALAKGFHDHMAHGQSLEDVEAQNSYRLKFFNDVVKEADEFSQIGQTSSGGSQMSSGGASQMSSGGASQMSVVASAQLRLEPRDTRLSVFNAAMSLLQFLDRDTSQNPNGGPRMPLLVLAFDESQLLADIPVARGSSLFVELLHALKILVDLPIFTLFLSTAGKFRLFSSETQSDGSDLILLPPISEISFDDLAFTAVEENIVLDDQVVTDEWISHLGRPLFGSRYDATVENATSPEAHSRELMDFAKKMLLNGPTTLGDIKGPGSLACLSVRFSIEFDLSDKSGWEMAHTQIERHMRLCVAATAGFNKLITIAGSEPYLAEAARELMSEVGAVRHLAENSSLNCVDRGQRGELVAALLIMRARDAASAASSSRQVSVIAFMKELLPLDAFEKLKSALPPYWNTLQELNFSETFEDYSTWFNHVIKINQPDMIKTEHLWKFLTRGAMVMCANNQYGVDIVIPVCQRQQKLSRHTVTAILIQVKNNTTFKVTPQTKLFDAMDPFDVHLRLFPTMGQTPLPVLHLVFALTSNENKVSIMAPPTRKRHHLDKFTSFDIWCAGLSSDTFRDIENDIEWYKSLLQRSLQPHDAFDLKEARDDYRDEWTARARGQLRRKMAPLSDPVDGHNFMHQVIHDAGSLT